MHLRPMAITWHLFKFPQYKKKKNFPGGPVVNTLHFHSGGTGSIPGQGTKIPHAACEN